MNKSQWAYALLMVSMVSFFSIGQANGQSKENDMEKRLAELEKRVAELEAVVKPSIKACNDASIDLRQVAVGFKCKTSKNVLYERVEKENFGEAWKDHSTGYIWSDKIGSYTNIWNDDRSKDNKDIKDGIIIDSPAVKACKDIGGTLPTRANFEKGEMNGFREVLPNIKDHWYWSSSVYSNGSDFAYDFGGKYGYVVNCYRYNVNTVRCVGR